MVEYMFRETAPLIRKGNGDKTYAFVPNGIESPNGSATLFVYELNANGGITSTTRLVADASGGKGLMSLGMADLVLSDSGGFASTLPGSYFGLSLCELDDTVFVSVSATQNTSVAGK